MKKHQYVSTLREKCIKKAQAGEILVLKKKDGFLDRLSFAELIALATNKYALTEQEIEDLKKEDLKKLLLSVHNYFL